MPCSASEAKAQMFPSIILNVSLFARWYWNVLKCFIVSSPVYQTRIESIGQVTDIWNPSCTSLCQRQQAANICQHKRTNTSSVQNFQRAKQEGFTQENKFGIYKFIFMWPPTSYEKLIEKFLCCLTRTKLPV